MKQPVSITRNGRERLIVLAVEEYQRLKRRDREVLRVGDLSDADLAAIAATETDPRNDHLNAELE